MARRGVKSHDMINVDFANVASNLEGLRLNSEEGEKFLDGPEVSRHCLNYMGFRYCYGRSEVGEVDAPKRHCLNYMGFKYCYGEDDVEVDQPMTRRQPKTDSPRRHCFSYMGIRYCYGRSEDRTQMAKQAALESKMGVESIALSGEQAESFLSGPDRRHCFSYMGFRYCNGRTEVESAPERHCFSYMGIRYCYGR